MPNIVKNTSFPSLLDLLAPHFCRGCGRLGDIFCERCKKDIIKNHKPICPNCKQPIAPDPSSTHTSNPAVSSLVCPNCPHLPPIFTISSRDTILGELIHTYKYDSVRALAKSFAELLDASLPTTHTLEQAFHSRQIILVPLPTATHHIRSRGFDHIDLIAKRLAHLRGYHLSPLILRAKNTVQVGADHETRLTQAKHAYSLNPKLSTTKDALYILLDDVWTTGASMLAAVNILRSAGATNIACAFLAYSV